ncbi:MAG: SPOR domain-containing protein [Treponema sp.]|nr:SPOR domain-containing protein [Treponema sp.]
MKKSFITFLIIFNVFTFHFFAQVKAKDVAHEAGQKASVDESLTYIKSQIEKISVAAEKRAVYILLGSLQEQMSLYDDARKSYAQAAGITAGNAEGMPKKNNEQLVLDAVRCALSCGDYKTANSYLNSAVRNSSDEKILAYVKLYAQWSSLCRAENVEELNEPLEMLKAYLKINSMKPVYPVILLTLWYVTGEETYSSQLLKDFADSTEAGIVKGDIQLLPTPFWFFVPKSGVAVQGSGTFSGVSELVKNDTASEAAEKTENGKNVEMKEKSSEESLPKFKKWQLGLFRTESNANLLSEELKKKGFESYITTETRASGTTYYIVIVNEDSKGTIADRLRSAGYDCYPVE